jgi:YD repeat-containing protein
MLTRLPVPIVIFFSILLVGSAVYSDPALTHGCAPTLGVRPAGYDITYIYDELGRLIAVVDPAGDTVVYNYDAVGNLLSISRYNSATVSIIKFTPNSGAVGASVTIYGTGFDTTPSQNAITF